jgi:CheY-like chemotaxis protein
VTPDNDIRSDQRKKQMETLECLLVDDNPVNQKVISKMLSRIGIVPELASNGLEAVEKCRARADAVAAAEAAAAAEGGGGGDGSNLTSTDATTGGVKKINSKKIKQYDIVFMDIWMPVMSGHESTKEIRATVPGVTATSPLIVAMTACVMPGDQQKCLDSGMNRYLSKPIRKEELSKTLEDWLDERARVEEELKVLSQRKLIQKKKREILQKRSNCLAVLTGGVDDMGKQVEAGLPSATVVGAEDDDEDEDEDEDDEDDSDLLELEEEGLDSVDDEEKFVDSNDREGFSGGHGHTNAADSQLPSLENNRIAAARQKRRLRIRLSNDPMLLSDSEGVLGCCDGGGGGLKIISVGADEVRAARLERKQRGSRSRGGSVSIQDPATGNILLVGQGDRSSGGDDYDESESEDDEDEEDEGGEGAVGVDAAQQVRSVFAEGVSLERLLSQTTIDSFHTANTHNTSQAEGTSSQRSSLLSNSSSLRTVRGV